MKTDSESVPQDATSVIATERRMVRWLLVIGILACAGYLAAEFYLLSDLRGFPLDDSWIHLQFARNLAAGEGLTYNPGRVVPGTTAPLWTALISIFHWIPGSPVLWIKLVGMLLYLAGIDATFRLARELALGPVLAGLAAFLTLSTGWLVWSALSGLEIPLFIALTLWGFILHLRERSRLSPPHLSLAVFGLAVLARPEGALLVLLALADRYLFPARAPDGAPHRPSARAIAIGLGVVAILVGPVMLFNLQAGGSILPSTFAAKTAGFQRWAPDLHYLYSILAIFFRPLPYMVLLAGAGLVTLIERLGTSRDRGLLPALWLFGLPVVYSLMGGASDEVVAGNFGRYFFPLYPVLAVVGVLGLERAVEALAARGLPGKLELPVRVLLLVVLVWPTVSSLVIGAGRYVQCIANVRDSDIQVAHWLGERLAPEALIAVNDVGAMKYFLPNRVLDLAGIVTPEVRHYKNEAIEKEGDWRLGVERFLDKEKPDYLVVFPSWFPWLLGESSPYRPVYGVEIPNNIAMGGDKLVVLATPWTRYPLAGLEEM